MNFPTGQPHIRRLSYETAVAGHAMHRSLPGTGAKVCCGHISHLLLPSDDDLPAGHCKHTSRSAVSWNVPLEHSLQLVLPKPAETVPGMQASQMVASTLGEARPVGHSSHLVSPWEG